MQLGLNNYLKKASYVKNSKKIKGKYGFIVVLKYSDGTEKTQQHAGFSTIEDADYERDIILGQIRNKKYLVYGSTLLKDYIIHWLEDEFKARVEKYSSYYSYNSVVNNHIIPVLGNKMMRTINTADIHRLYKRISDYSPSVAKQVKTIMVTFLDFAVKEFAIETNVAKGVRLPRCVETVYTDQTEHSERRFRADLPPFQSNLSALLSTSFRKSSAHLSGYECNDRFSIPPESLFRAL